MQISCTDSQELLTLASEEHDVETIKDIELEVYSLDKKIAKLEFHRMFNGEMDDSNAYIDIQSGAG